MTLANAKRIARYLGYALLFLLWVIVMGTPCLIFAFAARGEFTWERGEHDSDRIWLIQERQQKGIGYQTERRLGDAPEINDRVCVRTTVRFFLWEGSADGESADYCECFNADDSPASTTCPP